MKSELSGGKIHFKFELVRVDTFSLSLSDRHCMHCTFNARDMEECRIKRNARDFIMQNAEWGKMAGAASSFCPIKDVHKKE